MGWKSWVQNLSGWAVGLSVASGPALAICPAELGARLDAIATQPLLQRSRVGVLIETQGTARAERRVLYSRDADQFFIPASNTKLLTTAAALHRLGPDYRIRTSVYATSQESGLTTLRVVGRGDPSLTQDGLSRLAQQVAQAGIRRVSQLIGDDSYFPGAATNPHWEWEDVQAGYGAPVNSLILDRNAIGLRLVPQAIGQPLQVVWDNPALSQQWRIINQSQTVPVGQPEAVELGRELGQPVLYVSGQLVAGSEAETADIAVPDPAQAFLQQFQAALTQQGIAVGRAAVTTEPLPKLPDELAAIESPPLSELLVPTNRNSDNLYAEALLKTLGLAEHPSRPLQATEAGLESVIPALTSLGVDSTGFRLVDGSGIARQNLVTPRTLVTVLQGMAAHPQASVYRNSLAVAGESGTLRNRFRDTPVQGHLWGKTGALTGNVALSGYLVPSRYSPLVFTILVNNSDQRAGVLRAAMDEMLLEVVDLDAACE